MAEGRDFIHDLRAASVNEVRVAMVAVCAYACKGPIGAFQGDPVFDEVTEGRQDQQDAARRQNPHVVPYSGCTDLFSFCAEAVGVEDEEFVNRNDDGGRKPWATGGGPTFITRAAWYLDAKRHDVMTILGPGDALVVADPWHVCMVCAVDLVAMTIIVYEYGQFDTARGKACGRLNTHGLKRVGRDWVVIGRFERVVQGIVTADEFAKRITKPGRLPDDFAGTLRQ